MARRTKRPLSGGKKVLLTLCVIALLVALFFLSYWITTISLRAGRDDGAAPVQPSATPSASPTVNYEALSKAELIELLKERDERIRELESGNPASAITDIVPSQTPTPVPTPTAKPSATPAPTATAKPSAKPTATPTAKPTAKPTVKPTPLPTPEPTPAPTKTPTSIRPVAPAA